MTAATIKPIRSETDYHSAMERVSTLMDNASKTSEESDELEVLVVLVDEWENRTFKRATLTRTDMFNALMDARGAKPRDLVETVGTLGRVYQLVNGNRKISDEMAVKLAKYFGVTLETFNLPATVLSERAA